LRIDSDDNVKAEQIFNALGLNMTTAFNMFTKQTIRCEGIPFEVTLQNKSDDLLYGPANSAHINRSIAPLNTGKASARELIDIEDDD